MREQTLHPAAWWVWAMALAVMVSTTTNVVVLAITVGVVVVTVLARRPDAPWSRSLKMYLGLGAFIVTMRVVLHVLVGLKTGDPVVLPLPRVPLPSWAAGIQLLGPVGLGGLIGAALEGVRLATMLLCFGAANSLANPRKLLASLPHAVRDLGTATVIALTIAPQLVHSVVRVRTAQVLRGEASARGQARRVAMPVLHDSLERSVSLAAAMESRGFGRVRHTPLWQRRLLALLTFVGVSLACIGLFLVLSGTGGWWLLAAGMLACAVSLHLSGRAMRRTQYRPQRWGVDETITALCGVLACIAVRWIFAANPATLMTPTDPLGLPALPWFLPLALLLAAIPAVLGPSAKTAPDHLAAQPTATPSQQHERATHVRQLLRG